MPATAHQSTSPHPTPSALTGIRVLDLSRILSGPFATMILGDLGAEVIKVEDTRQGDDTRQWGPPFQGPESSYFLSANRNKRGIGIDLKTEGGIGLLHKLARRADVFVENFRPGTAERLGLGYGALAEENPGLIYASISGYGHTGPWSARPGYDAIAQAESGMMSITGEASGPPLRPGVATADLAAGMWATIGILAALQARTHTGRGQHLDVSLLDGQLAWLSYVASGWFTTGNPPARHGSAHPTIVPYQALPTADGHLMVAVGNDRIWQRFTRALEAPTLGTDPRFSTNPDRVRHRGELIPLLEKALTRRSTQDWAATLTEAGVPCAPISTVAEALTSPQATARGMITHLDHPTAGPIRTVGSPLRLSATPPRIRTAPPVLGQHTDEILTEAGYDRTAIARLRAEGAVR
ncbi:CaiB/BaiF CoA transferase family protein [Kitasatospora cineracea]|uniref:Formyl-CoA transferase/CoA:oxalate CoA-transferase n=1 Tax=Kitasatospora cineracea TaxID=88074 RepID=A0A8G1UM65_9ACTN|nr:CoA transferase [Kitasatospora cineracea]ROR46557.1 formyl-CoA transferase/CoA:oxalate CoA-transferase [Kitasatospora cineracea]